MWSYRNNSPKIDLPASPHAQQKGPIDDHRLLPTEGLSEPRELVAAIRARRSGALLNIDRMLLHSRPLAQGGNSYLRAVRSELAASPKLRELAICVVALPNHADYEYHYRAPEFLREGGTARQLDGLGNLTNADVAPRVRRRRARGAGPRN